MFNVNIQFDVRCVENSIEASCRTRTSCDMQRRFSCNQLCFLSSLYLTSFTSLSLFLFISLSFISHLFFSFSLFTFYSIIFSWAFEDDAWWVFFLSKPNLPGWRRSHQNPWDSRGPRQLQCDSFKNLKVSHEVLQLKKIVKIIVSRLRQFFLKKCLRLLLTLPIHRKSSSLEQGMWFKYVKFRVR